MRRVFEDVLDAVGEGFVSPGSGDGGDGDQEQDGFDEFRFHGMRMLFVFCWLSLIGRFASLLLVYPSAPQLCVRPEYFFRAMPRGAGNGTKKRSRPDTLTPEVDPKTCLQPRPLQALF
jgi:hypothetical protein